MTVESLFRWTREAPQGWHEALRRLAPPQERMSWLHLHWAPGTPAAPMQRWVIFECVPAIAVAGNGFLEGLLANLFGNPWAQAMHAWTARFWLTHQALPTPFWVLQGPFGGHKYRYTNDESEFAQWQGYGPTAPLIGDLPYAELTPLTLALIRTHSVMTGQRHATFEAERKRRTEALQRDCRRLLLHQIGESGVVDTALEAAPALASHGRRVEKGQGAHGDLSAMSDKYIRTGVLDPNE